MNDHPLPWAVIQTNPETPAYIVDVEGNQVVRMTAAQAEAARHIVACVNVCRGFDTSKLAAMPPGFMLSMARAFQANFTESEGGKA